MTKDEIIKMARQAGGIDLTNTRANVTIWIGTGTSDFLDAFAQLVEEKEREACAKVCDEYAIGLERNYSEIIADKIRARGHKGAVE